MNNRDHLLLETNPTRFLIEQLVVLDGPSVRVGNAMDVVISCFPQVTLRDVLRAAATTQGVALVYPDSLRESLNKARDLSDINEKDVEREIKGAQGDE